MPPVASAALLACCLFFFPSAENQASTPQPLPPVGEAQEQQSPQSFPGPKETGSTLAPADLEQHAWQILEAGAKIAKKQDRAAAVHATGLIPNNARARRIAESALKDDAPEVRAAAAAALGDMQSKSSIPKLRATTEDTDPSVALAAAHALLQLHDESGYSVYYELLTGERKTGKSTLAEIEAYKDPKKLAEVGFHEALGFIPYAGIGWRALKVVKKGDASPERAAAASVLAKDNDPTTTKALVNAVGDESWIVRAAALEALAKRDDPSVVDTVGLYLADEEGEVKYTAAATALRLTEMKKLRAKTKRPKKN